MNPNIYWNFYICIYVPLTLSLRRSLSYKNQFIVLHSKSIDCFLYDRDLRQELMYNVPKVSDTH